MTVERLRAEMSEREFMQWTRYYAAKNMQAEMDQAMADAKARRG